MVKMMSFYPSDEYDSSELERERASGAKWHLKRWFGRSRQDDDDDDPPPVPAGARRPLPPLPLAGAAAEAA